MITQLANSELIVNYNETIYHCNIRSEELADTIILVGNPDRAPKVYQYFDTIEVKSQQREIVTNTVILNVKRLTVISTGMGTNNIEIVINELDALVNINLEKKEIKTLPTQLTFIRLETSGALQADIPVDSLVASSHGLGFDGLLSFYSHTEPYFTHELAEAFTFQTQWDKNRVNPYIVDDSKELLDLMIANYHVVAGITATSIRFYGSQGRVLRLGLYDEKMNDKLSHFEYKGYRITNFEMETSAIYGLSKLIGHKALSLNTIIANQYAGTFSRDPYTSVDQMIQFALERLTK